jgi:Caspase domain
VTDFAVVVGVARYPQLSAEGVTADLEGPDNDAQAVRDWLVDPEGGQLDQDNVKLIRSSEFDPLDPEDPQPAKHRIERELNWVEQQTQQTPGGRLYLYFSGHGFSPVLEEGALFTAEATQVGPAYVYAHAWLRWFRRAQRFRESVLWMDCCMNYQQSIPVAEVLMRAQIGTGVPGPAFIALAAQTKNALESTMPDGQVHGVFTWTLLQGLRGGASDMRGRVTGESLRTFLYTAMPEFLPSDTRNAAAVDLQPFVRADEGLVFRRLPARPKYRVHLTLPAGAAGKELRIWTGRPLQVMSEVLTGDEWTGELLRGLYVAEVPEAGLRHGFQVAGTGDVEVKVTSSGPAVVAPDTSELFSIDVVADNKAAFIAMTDYDLNRIFVETGELHEREAPGVYKVRLEFGRDIAMVSEYVVLLDRDFVAGSQITALQLPSPAPIPGTSFTNETHEEPFSDAADRRGAFTGPAPGQAAISVLARYWTDPEERQTTELTLPHPMEGLQLVDLTGQTIAELSQDCQVDDRDEVDPVAVWDREVPPGHYYLRRNQPNGRRLEACVTASADWVTQIAIRRGVPVSLDDRKTTTVARAGVIGEVALFMRPAGGRTGDPEQDEVIEAARLALAQGRNLLAEGNGTQLQELLLLKYADPIAGIIGCHLLLRAMNERPLDPARLELFDTAVSNLRQLVGPDHPDVEALSLRCTDPALRPDRPFSVPPMFSHSWQLVTEASYERPELVPIELWKRVHAVVGVGPFFVWAADEDTRAIHAEQLSHWIDEYPGGARERPSAAPTRAYEALPATAGDMGGSSLPDAARDAAMRLRVPASAAQALWEDRSVPQQPDSQRPDDV